ncbi:MAG: protein translocase subunit SecF [Alphaproteobacteria bacterium]|nr:protein translocase subunit SecF [Alphaproteobacteria bacterium]
MKKLRIVPANTAIDFIGRRTIAFAFSAALILGSLGLAFGSGLNLGIDFLGGILLEVKTDGPADVAQLRSDLGSLGLGEVSLQEFGSPDVVLIRVQRQEGGDEAQQKAITIIRGALGEQVDEYRRTETVGPTVGAELKEAAIWAVGSAILAILVYIWFRFEWQFGIAAIVALIHDVLTTIGLFALFQLEFNLATVAAVLTIAGYSINDTVVVFDRVRENLRKYKKMSLVELFNLSINETLSRTTITSVTTLLALGALFFLGGEVISGFSMALIWGVVIGTYSSIALAVPILLYLDIDRGTGDEGAGASLEAAG